MKLKYFCFDYELVNGPYVNDVWAIAFRRKALNWYSPNEMRIGIRIGEIMGTTVEAAGEHLSYFMSSDLIQEKIRSFSHQEFNTEEFHERLQPRKIIQDRRDLFDREGMDWQISKDKLKFNYVYENPSVYFKYWSDYYLDDSDSIKDKS